ncbi:MAG: triphosphoribosyl-dephospho-CoA synthase [Synergistaceae bacterium]|nr:triphosphoribosyl-dephospho-CoA synthase [Synergistaceae bacterium]
MNEIYVFNTAKLAVKSIISTASVYPKPGLVTPIDESPLDGTDFPCLLDGAMSLLQCFVNCASAGADTESMKPVDVFSILRSPGRIGSNDALCATRGRLAMKGHVLCMGLLCAAAGRLLAQKRILTPGALMLTASSFAEGLTARELWPLTDNTGGKVLSPGERAYITYGLEGCRGEAEHGYARTMKAAEALRRLEATQGQLNFRERVTHALLEVMSENQDTSLAAHGGISELMRVQEEAREAVSAGGMLTTEGLDAVFAMDKNLRSRGASPTGSSVVMSCALFVRELGSMRLTRSGYDE